MNNIHLDDWEKVGNYITKTISLSNLEEILINSIKDNPINEVIVSEMLEVFHEYEKITKMGEN